MQYVDARTYLLSIVGLDGEARDVLLDRRVKVQHPFLPQLGHRRHRDGLADAGDAHDRIGRTSDIVLEV